MKHVLLLLPLAGLSFGCGNKLTDVECNKLRVDAFEIINKAHHCNTDADCRQSEWPGCQKPMSEKTFASVGEFRKTFDEGKCEEPKADCPEPPEVYCKQGLCVHREKGVPEGQPGADEIKLE